MKHLNYGDYANHGESEINVCGVRVESVSQRDNPGYDPSFERYCANTVNITDERYTEIPDDAFSSATSIETVTMHNKMRRIGESAFEGCVSLESIHIPASVTEIGKFAFLGCTYLKNIVLDENNPSFCVVDGVLFTADGNELLVYPARREGEEYVIPRGVSKIAPGAFFKARHLKRVVLPAGLEEIGEMAFFNCLRLNSVGFAEGPLKIGESAFTSCLSLKEIIFANGLTKIGNKAFRGCAELEKAFFPNGIKYIGELAFEGCVKLAGELFLPDSLTHVGDNSFAGCKLLTLTANNEVYKKFYYKTGGWVRGRNLEEELS